MAENKKSFVLYADLIHTVKKMKDAHAGQLLKTILSYVNDENPTIVNPIVDLVFEPIKRQMKRDLIKYEKKKVQWSNAGKASAEARKKGNEQSTDSTDVEKRSTDSTVTVNDNVTVTVNDNVTVSSNDDVVTAHAREYPSSTPTAKEFQKIEKLKTEFAADQPWLDERGKEFSLAREGIISRLDDFCTHLRGGKDHFKTRKDFANHFRNWLRKNINGSINQKGNGSPTEALMRW